MATRSTRSEGRRPSNIISRRKVLVLCGSVLVLFSLAFSFGVAVGHYQVFPYDQVRTLRRSVLRIETGQIQDGITKTKPPGRWHAARETPAQVSAKNETVDQLSSLGYLGGYALAEHAGGTTTFDANKAQDGLTLFSSGHAPVAYLISPSGEVVHEWKIEFEKLWPAALPFETSEEHKQFIRRARVFPNGDLIAVFEYIGIVKVDKDSNVLWKSLNQNHHDFAIAADGSIVTLVRSLLPCDEMARDFPGSKCTDPGILDDQIAILDPSGVELKRVSLFDAFYRSEYAPFLRLGAGSKTASQRNPAYSDIFHANSVHIVEPGQGNSVISTGEILVSLREMHAVVSVDPEEERVLWMTTGKWRGQHQAQLLESGNILLLDNLGGNRRAPLKLNKSRILEVNPLSQKIVWRYLGSRKSPFFTHWLGYVERLENGNTLVTESSRGRIFEVSKQGRIVWEYLNPHRAGDGNELIATVMGAQRISMEDLEFLER